MNTNNKKLGNSFESELCNILGANGFWAYNAVNKASGQPADIMAAKNNIPYLIDCKVCSDDSFPLSRIEENQYNSMMKFDYCGCYESYFALKFSDGEIYMMPSNVLFMALNSGMKRMLKSQIKASGYKLEKWVER